MIVRFLVIFLLVSMQPRPAMAQAAGDVKALRQEIEQLKKEQQALRAELDALRRAVAARPAVPPPGTEAQDLIIDIAGEPIRGDRNARVVIVEFSDYQCPFCARYWRETLPQLDRDYIRTGKLRYVFRDLPIESIHPQAFKAHEAANCAGDQNKYWDMHDRLFANPQALAVPALMGHAQAMGLDMGKFQACLDTGRHAGEVRQDLAAAQAASINSTPNFFIGLLEPNGTVRSQLKITGAKQYAVFKAAIDSVLSQAQ